MNKGAITHSLGLHVSTAASILHHMFHNKTQIVTSEYVLFDLVECTIFVFVLAANVENKIQVFAVLCLKQDILTQQHWRKTIK